jgi:hypothetical protein
MLTNSNPFAISNPKLDWLPLILGVGVGLFHAQFATELDPALNSTYTQLLIMAFSFGLLWMYIWDTLWLGSHPMPNLLRSMIKGFFLLGISAILAIYQLQDVGSMSLWVETAQKGLSAYTGFAGGLYIYVLLQSRSGSGRRQTPESGTSC